MEFTQFISYLDYGVLGLSAIILILSFVLLSREQKRDVFRPEVASAIRKYMMLALAFAGIGLVSTIVDGVMVQPSKEKLEIATMTEKLDIGFKEIDLAEFDTALAVIDEIALNPENVTIKGSGGTFSLDSIKTIDHSHNIKQKKKLLEKTLKGKDKEVTNKVLNNLDSRGHSFVIDEKEKPKQKKEPAVKE